jgi:hypothetical protein
MRKLRGFSFRVVGDYGIEIRLTKEAIKDLSHAGDCSFDVEHWQTLLAPQMAHLPAELVRKILYSYTDWSEEELADHVANLGRLLWIAAGDAQQENTQQVWLDGS